MFVNYEQDNWLEKLAIVEFAVHYNKSFCTKLSSFFTTKSLHLHICFDIIDFSDTSTSGQIVKKKTLDIFGNMKTT